MEQRDNGSSGSAMDDLATVLELVGAYMEKFYRNEPNDDVASDAALLTVGPNWQERWRIATAFRFLLDTPLSAGILKGLVKRCANREVSNDDQAREYLRKIFSLSSLDAAVNFDELT
jgi:hypothetical protein